MASQTLGTLHDFLLERDTPVSTAGAIKSFSHDLGTGPVLALVHGWPQSSYMWRHVLPLFKDHISLFVAELPGYGFSSPAASYDKRSIGRLILSALRAVFGPDRDVIWCGHDRGARVGHRLLVDSDPSHRLVAGVLMDIVPTTEQWAAFSSPSASIAYYHWPFLATPTAPHMIKQIGGGEFARINLERAAGKNPEGAAKLRGDDAFAHYAAQFAGEECIAGACADYAAAAGEDLEEQKADQEAGRKVKLPTMVIYSAGNLGRMHDVTATWDRWIAEGTDVRYEAVADGYGHYLPEECPERIAPLVLEWVKKYGK